MDDFPRPVSDPAAEGLPDTADDDSTAYDDVESPRIADGPDPAPLPADEPVALDDYGTAAGDRHESLDHRLAREEPDLGPDDVYVPVDPVRALEDVGHTGGVEPAGEAAAAERFERGRAPDPLDEVPVDPDPVPTLDRFDDRRPVGRLVQPDEGITGDAEADEVARDAGAAGGGPSAEEATMHEI